MIEWLQPLQLRNEEPLEPGEWWTLVGVCIALVTFAGLASGLTLGLMSLDVVDMEVLKRSGTEAEKRCAARIIPVIANEHFLLVTLLLCNAAANEALPLFLDRLADPLTAVLLSTSVVLVFGEVLPQALCSRYGLQIGASSAWFVRLLMALCAPLAWPIGKLLDVLLGGEHSALFRRAQLKALVGLHGEGEGLGGTLSVDEISIISGALDLTHKTAWAAMTPMDKVFMLPVERPLDEACLQDILSRGHSRVPVYTNGDRSCVVGLLLVKELVLADPAEGLTVGQLPMRALPALSASTPLYDMLKLFESGGSHMAMLTRPAGAAGARASTPAGGMSRARSGLIVSGASAYIIEAADAGPCAAPACSGDGGEAWAPPGGWGDVRPGDAVGIITIEDVIEELLGAEIIDETDLFVDNQQTSRVDAGELSKQLPARLRKVLARGEFTPRVGRLGFTRSGASWSGGPTQPTSPGSGGALAGPFHTRPDGGLPRRHHPHVPQVFYHPEQQQRGGSGGGAAPHGGGAAGAGGAAGGGVAGAAGQGIGPIERVPSDSIPIRGLGAGTAGATVGTPGAAGSWAAGANTGARRVRFGSHADPHHSSVVLKPRLLDPDDS